MRVMLRRRALWGLLLIGAVAAGLTRGRPTAAQPPSFDKLADADRKVLAERFRRDVWPLLARGGKDGCVGCHTGGNMSGLRFAGDADKDFARLLREGFFLKDDAGSLLSRIQDGDKKGGCRPPRVRRGPRWRKRLWPIWSTIFTTERNPKR